MTTEVQAKGCTKVEEPVRDIHVVRQVSPRGDNEDAVSPGVFVPNSCNDRYGINNDDVAIRTKGHDATTSMSQVSMRFGKDYILEDAPTPVMITAPTPATSPTKRGIGSQHHTVSRCIFSRLA